MLLCTYISRMSELKVVERDEKPNGKEHTFEEAVQLIGIGRTHYVIEFVAFTSVMTVAVEGLNMGFVLPLAKCDLHISTIQQGVINAIGFFGILMPSHLWGFVSDTWGRIKVIRLCLGMSLLMCALSSLSYTSDMLLITRFINGLFLSGIQSAGITYVSEFHANKSRVKYSNRAAMGMTGAILYQALVGLALLPMQWSFPLLGGGGGGLVFKPWRLYLLVTSAMSTAVPFGLAMFLPESPKFLLAIGRIDKCVQVLKMLYDKTAASEAEYPVQRVVRTEFGTNVSSVSNLLGVLKMIWNQTMPVFKQPYLLKTASIAFVLIVIFFTNHGLYLWFPQIMMLYLDNKDAGLSFCSAIAMAPPTNSSAASTSHSINGLPTTQMDECVEHSPNIVIYYVTICNGISLLVFTMIATKLMKYFGKTLVIAIWLSVGGLAMLALIWTNNFYLNVCMFLLAFNSAACGASICGIVPEFFPTQYKSMAFAIIMMISRMGSFFGSNVTGNLLFGFCHEMLGIYAAIIICAVAVFIFLMRLKK